MSYESNRRILVADDQDDLRTLLSQLLSVEGFDVVTAGDGREAIEALQGNTIDVALLDIQMPHLSGIQVLQFIKDRRLKTRAIMLTGYADLRYAMEARELGAIEFVSKPYQLEEIVAAIYSSFPASHQVQKK